LKPPFSFPRILNTPPLTFPISGIASLVSPSDTFYAYCDPNSAEDFLSTLSELDEHISSASPPYDAVMGFSQGSCLAATLLLRKSLRGEPLPFKCAVFLSAGMALDWESLERGEVEMYGGRVVDGEKWERGKGAIGIPTAHVWGTKDACAPGQGRLLSELCSAEGREIAVHGGEHSVPGAGVQKDLMAAVGAIERTIKRAEA
jgi:predicted esterase